MTISSEELEIYELEKTIVRVSDRIEFFKKLRESHLNQALKLEADSRNHRGYGYETILKSDAERSLASAISFEEKIRDEQERLRQLNEELKFKKGE